MDLIHLTSIGSDGKHEIAFRPDQYLASHKDEHSITVMFLNGENARMTYGSAEDANSDYEGMMWALEGAK